MLSFAFLVVLYIARMVPNYFDRSTVKHARQNIDKKAQLSLTTPQRRESMRKIAPVRRAYNVVADNTGLSSFV